MRAQAALAFSIVVAIVSALQSPDASELLSRSELSRLAPEMSRLIRLEVVNGGLNSNVTTMAMSKGERDAVESALAKAWTRQGFPLDRAIEMVRDDVGSGPPSQLRFAAVMMAGGSEQSSGGSDADFNEARFRKGSVEGAIESNRSQCRSWIEETAQPSRRIEVQLADGRIRSILVTSSTAESILFTQSQEGEVSLLSSMKGTTASIREASFPMLISRHSAEVYGLLLRPLSALGIAATFSPQSEGVAKKALSALKMDGQDAALTIDELPDTNLLALPGFLASLLDVASDAEKTVVVSRLEAVTSASATEFNGDWWDAMLAKRK